MYLPISRVASKKLAVILIAAGVILAPDMILPTFTDFINIGMAMILADVLGISFFEGLMLTFTVAFTMIAAGFLIYPYNTRKMMKAKISGMISLARSNPVMIVAAVAVAILLYWYGSMFYDTMYQSVKKYAAGIAGGL